MSRLGLGLMRLESLTVEDVEKLLLNAKEDGITFLDLADIYGGTGSEKKVGEAFKRNPGLRDAFYLQTKVGIAAWTKGYDSSYDYLMQMTKNCLERLHTDHLDSLLIHRPDIFMDNEEVARAVHNLKKEGLIKDFGVSNFSKEEIMYLEETMPGEIKYNQVLLGLGNTTMIDRTMVTNMAGHVVDDLFFFLKRKKITIQCWSPFQYGFFEGSIFNEEKYPELNAALKKYADKYHTTKCGIAASFLFRLEKNLIVLTGSTKRNQILEAMDGENVVMSKEDWYRLYAETGHLLP